MEFLEQIKERIMEKFLATRTKKPNAAQKAQIKKMLKEISHELVMCIGTQPGEMAFYVAAPEYWGASHMQEQCNAVVRAVDSVF